MKPGGLYRLLGVGKKATAVEIKAAFRTKAKAAHPDAGGSDEAYRALALARDVLSNDDRRRTYDETGKADEPKPDNTDQEAMAVISGLIAVILQGTVPITEIDAVQAIRDTINKRLSEIVEQHRACRRAKERIDKIRGRFKAKKAAKNPVMFERMLDWHASQIDLAIDKGEAMMRHHQRALELVEDFTFEFDRPDGYWSVSTPFSSTSTR